MKTLVALSALVAVTIAAPTVSEFSFGPSKISNREPRFQFATREKKSTEATENAHVDADVLPLISERSQNEASETSARTLLKKPIIIKKTKGHHHLYRDSEEEQADAESGETCRKEVKVKICDAASLAGKPIDKMTIEGAASQMSDGDMHHSIKMAKEAVENLQKDLQKLESETGQKQWKHTNTEKDDEMHADIEKARQALEHFQNNFGALESIQSHSSVMKDAEALEDAHRQLSEIESENERIAQWKEAMENIQKNTEIARNIENSFKSAQMHQSKLMETEKVETQAKHVETPETEMSASASEHNEMTMNQNVALNDEHMGTNDTPKQATFDVEPTSHLEKKSSEDQVADIKQKEAEELKTSLKVSEKMDSKKTVGDKSRSTMEEKDEDIFLLQMKNSLAKSSDGNENMLNHESNMSLTTDGQKEVDGKEKEADIENAKKSAENDQNNEKDKQAKASDNVQIKEAEHIDMESDSSNIREHISAAPVHEHMLFKEAAEIKGESHSKDQAMRMEMVLTPNSQVSSLSKVTPNSFEKSHENMMAHGKSANMEVAGLTSLQMKDSARQSLLDHNNDKWKQEHNQVAGRGAYGLGGYGTASAGAGGIIGAGSATSSSGPGAVGVFPNAKVGGCAIPLLLSCSPSVVSGSLAHSGSYSAPTAYRAGNDVKLHKKRDAKKEIKPQFNKIKRTPTRIIEKLPYNFDKAF